MMARAWNRLVCRTWYALGCPDRFPVRQIRNTRDGWSRADLVGVAIVGALIGLWLSPGRAYADPVPDKPGGVYVQRIDTRPAGPAIRVTLANSSGVPVRTEILRPCVYEDGRRCYWIGSDMGNGRGRDFLVLSGRVFAVNLSWIGGAR